VKFVVPVLLATALAAGAAVSEAAGMPKAPSARDELIQLEQRWVEALERRDAVAVGAILADDFVDTTYRGERRTRRQALDGLTSRSRADTTQRLSDLGVRLYGSVGIVTGVNTVTGRNPDFTVRVRFTDVFVRRNGVWKAVSAQETLEGNTP
jgi:ketosteroid isomerase-like protein